MTAQPSPKLIVGQVGLSRFNLRIRQKSGKHRYRFGPHEMRRTHNNSEDDAVSRKHQERKSFSLIRR